MAVRGAYKPVQRYWAPTVGFLFDDQSQIKVWKGRGGRGGGGGATDTEAISPMEAAIASDPIHDSIVP